MNLNSFSHRWQEQLYDILTRGEQTSPRGLLTRELPQYTLEALDMRHPVLTIPERKLSYRFMAAEAYWILTGDDRLATIESYNKEIAKFSDDGQTFFGAYGPKIKAQLDYVVMCLHDRPDTRQAGLTIWRENPPQTRDLPCTIAVFFHIRGDHLNCHVFMRSSDVWLGVPYDVFNMSMLAYLVCGKLWKLGTKVSPGGLWLTAASSHLYQPTWDSAWQCIQTVPRSSNWPSLDLHRDPDALLRWLQHLREAAPGSEWRWWE
jgi:thymidylate synthase